MTKGIMGRKRVQIIEIIKIQVTASRCETWENCLPNASLLMNDDQDKCNWNTLTISFSTTMCISTYWGTTFCGWKKKSRLDVKMLLRWMWRDFYIQNRTRSITKADPPDSSPPTSLVLLGTLSDMILSRRWSISLPFPALSLILPFPLSPHILVDPISPFFPHAPIHLLSSSVSWMVFRLNVILIFKLQNN